MPRPKLFGYGALPLLLVIPCIVFTAYTLPKLQCMNKVHRRIWDDMANEVRFDEPAALPKTIRLGELSTRAKQAGSGGRPDGHRVGDSSTLRDTHTFKHDHGSSSGHSSVDSGAGSLVVPTSHANEVDVSSYGNAPGTLLWLDSY